MSSQLTESREPDTQARPTIVAGNWKMNLGRADVLAFAEALRDFYAEREASSSGGGTATAMLFPSAPFLLPLFDRLRSTPVIVGAQDLHPNPSGAHTGDVSASQLRSTGATWVLCGHSERRHDHGESSDLVAAKTKAALDAGLAPMVCVGETQEQREADQTEAVLAEQLAAVLAACPTFGQESSPYGLRGAIAYEPVWAIGTGLTATPEMAQEAHAFLRQQVAHHQGDDAATGLPLLYGGSAKPANCESLVAQTDVDGLLVGGASLDSSSFLDMIRRCGS